MSRDREVVWIVFFLHRDTLRIKPRERVFTPETGTLTIPEVHSPFGPSSVSPFLIET